MRKGFLVFALVILFIGIICMGEVGAQTYPYPPVEPLTRGAYVRQSGPWFKWCAGPHKFHIDVRARVHHWIFTWFSSTRIYYDVWKPGNYRVRKKLFAYSNEPIVVTISGVNNLVHIQNPNFPPIYHWVGLAPDPPTADEIIALTDPALADQLGPDGALIPVWTEPEQLEADPDWAPGTRMPLAVAKALQLETPPIGEDAKDPEAGGLEPILEFTLSVQEPETTFLAADTAVLERAPMQYNQAPVRVIENADPYIIRKWLYDGICVGFWNRSCNYWDPYGYDVTVSANPVYPHYPIYFSANYVHELYNAAPPILPFDPAAGGN